MAKPSALSPDPLVGRVARQKVVRVPSAAKHRRSDIIVNRVAYRNIILAIAF
jgi:hypothetical protein